MGIFSKKKPKPMAELANLGGTLGATARDYPLTEEFAGFKSGFEKLAKRHIRKCKTDFLNYDLLDARIDAVAEEQKAQNQMQYVDNCLANSAVSQQIKAYQKINDNYINLLNEIMKGDEHEQY